MPQNANDGSLVRGSYDITIAGVVYTLQDYKRGAKSRTEVTYNAFGKPQDASHAEDLEVITGTIKKRSDKVDPPKFVIFGFDAKNWYVKEREESGSAPGTKEFSVEIWESINGAITLS